MGVAHLFIILSAGVLLLLLGFLFKQGRVNKVLEDLDSIKALDKWGLARWIGSNLKLMGAVIIAVSIAATLAYYVSKELEMSAPPVFDGMSGSILTLVFLAVIFCIRIVSGSSRFKKL